MQKPLHLTSRHHLIAGTVFVAATLGSQPQALALTYDVPVQQSSEWELLTYNRIPANTVSFSKEGIRIEVDQSASPLIYPLQQSGLVDEVMVTLEISGDIDLNGQQQGEKGSDDFVFRLGLVHEGDQTLNFLQRSVAAGWIKKLYSMAPDGTGISNIQFYNVYSDNRLAEQSREHPLSDLMVEHFIAAKPADGKLSISFTPKIDKPVLALWISIDGDDTKSAYQVLIKDLVLKTR